MKSRKNIFAAMIVSAAVIMSGCGSADMPPAGESAAGEYPLSAPEDIGSGEAAASEAPESEAAPDKECTLEDIPFSVLSRARFETTIQVENLVGYNMGKFRGIMYDSPTTFLIRENTVMSRRSCGQMGEAALSSAKLPGYIRPVDISGYPIFEVESITLPAREGDNAVIRVGSVEAEYYIGDRPKLRGFVRRISDERVEVVIDPAFMGDIPMLTSEDRFLTFDINGETMYADTISFTANMNDEEIGGVIGRDNFEYVYAMFDIKWLGVRFNTSSGYESSGQVENIKVLTENTSDVIGSRYMFEENDKGSDADKVYNALKNSIDSIYNEDVAGINLLDMDKSGFPELIVTRLTDSASAVCNFDVDVYDLSSGEAALVGTIKNVTQIPTYTDTATPYLYLKPLGEDDFAWLALTRESEGDTLIQRAVLYRLKDGVLSDEELFCLTLNDGKFSPLTLKGSTVNINEHISGDGEKTYTADTDLGEIPLYYDDFDMVCLSYLNKYVEDVCEMKLLYIDRIVALNDNSGGIWFYHRNKRYEPSDRDMIFGLARLTDEYFAEKESEGRLVYFDMWGGGAMKPVIYLYPTEETEVEVTVDFPYGGSFTCTYPEYNGGWNVTAEPDGTLFDSSGNEYYCLYWEGEKLPLSDTGEGFCVAGRDTAAFLREKLMYIGLTAREANEFIIYWLPKMQDNPYNIITFHTSDYSEAAKLAVSPAPDSVIRVFMTYEASDKAVNIPPQELPRYERSGFTLVEWGGDEQLTVVS